MCVIRMCRTRRKYGGVRLRDTGLRRKMQTNRLAKMKISAYARRVQDLTAGVNAVSNRPLVVHTTSRSVVF